MAKESSCSRSSLMPRGRAVAVCEIVEVELLEMIAASELRCVPVHAVEPIQINRPACRMVVLGGRPATSIRTNATWSRDVEPEPGQGHLIDHEVRSWY